MKSFDKAFKKLLEDPFLIYEFIKKFLPAFVDEYEVTQESIELKNTQFLSADLKTKLADVLAYVKTEKTEKFIYILIEYQSYKDHNMALRLYNYSGKIWERYVKDNYPRSRRKDFKYPQVIPIVFYTGEGRWTPVKNISDKIDYAKGFEKYTPKCEYFVVELSQLDKKWLLKVRPILSKLLYVIKAEDIEEIFKELKEAINELDKDKKEKFYSYLKSLLIGSGLSAKEAQQVVDEMEEEEGEGEGMIKILEKERLEGAVERARNDIYEILEARFGDVPEDIEEAIEKITNL